MQRWLLDSILTCSATLVVGGVVGLATSRHLGASVAGVVVGGIGGTIVKQKRDSYLRESLKHEVTAQVKQKIIDLLQQDRRTLDEAVLLEVKHEIQGCFDHYQENFEQKLKVEQKLNQENFEQKLLKVEQELKDALEQSKRHQQSTQDNIKNLKKQLKVIEERLSQTPTTPKHSPREASSALQSEEVFSRSEGVITWLNSQGVTVESYRTAKPSAVEQAFDSIAIYLGMHYPCLDKLHMRLKANVRVGNRFNFSLRNRTQEDIQIHTKFCTMLKQAGYLREYHYAKEEKVMSIASHCRSDFESFIHGEWFERFIFYKVSEFFQSQGLSYECLMNAEVIFPNRNRYELDMLFLIEGNPIWIECKAGVNYDKFLPIYSSHRSILQIPKSNALIVSLLIDANEAITRTDLWEVTIVNLDSLLPFIQTALEVIINQETPQAISIDRVVHDLEKNDVLVYPDMSTALTANSGNNSLVA